MRKENTALRGQVSFLKKKLAGSNEHYTQQDSQVARLTKENTALRTSYREMKRTLESEIRKERVVYDFLGSNKHVVNAAPTAPNRTLSS